MPPKYSDPEYQRNRKIVLAGNPTCALCGGEKPDTVDHIVGLMNGGDHSLANLQPAHRRCNSIKGNRDQARAADKRKQARQFFVDKGLTPTLINPLSLENQPELAGTGLIDLGDANIGREQPRLETIDLGGQSFGPLVQAWAKRHMSVDLMPWQVHAINGALTCDDAGDPYSLTFREALTTTARQQGKSVALVALIGWWMTDYAQLRGEPQSVLSVANKLDRAEAIFAQLAHVLVEQFGGKQMAAVGRKSVTVGKSEWLIRAATKNLHG